MSFHLSADEGSICIRDDHKLFALLETSSGELVESEIDLNEHLGNNEGHFQWEGVSFSESAEPGSVSFQIEGGGAVPVLRARLASPDGEWHDADVNLSERIVNDDGQFKFQ